MAKKSKIAKDQKQRKMVAHYAARRKELKENGDYAALAKLPKDSSPVRLKNRCGQTGRPRGYLRKFGLSRIAFRSLAHQGEVPGIRKASW